MQHQFETDFWRDAKLRKIWDDIVPGEPRKTIPYVLTLAAIQEYCRSVGDLHPLYFDEAYGALQHLWRPDRAAGNPYSFDVRVHASGRLDALTRNGQCRAILELQQAGAAGRHDPARSARAR